MPTDTGTARGFSRGMRHSEGAEPTVTVTSKARERIKVDHRRTSQGGVDFGPLDTRLKP